MIDYIAEVIDMVLGLDVINWWSMVDEMEEQDVLWMCI